MRVTHYYSSVKFRLWINDPWGLRLRLVYSRRLSIASRIFCEGDYLACNEKGQVEARSSMEWWSPVL